ncbi:MAG: hypothetical protein DM484_07470, partial [Candidatus Methylumidiphilus alinenensis]
FQFWLHRCDATLLSARLGVASARAIGGRGITQPAQAEGSCRRRRKVGDTPQSGEAFTLAGARGETP